MQVVYINTSLKTKALAHQQVPTITCTSSNVVQTVLTAFAQVGRRTWLHAHCLGNALRAYVAQGGAHALHAAAG